MSIANSSLANKRAAQISHGNRPLAIRLAPWWLRGSLFDRFYSRRRDRWLHLYRDATLSAAPQVSMQLVPGDRLSDIIAFTGVHEPHLTRQILRLGRQGGMMIDIGANLGYFTLLWASCNPANRCVAFEAAPRNLENLHANVARNGMSDSVRVIAAAVATRSGKVFFDPGPEDQRGWGGITMNESEDRIQVDAVRVDEVIDQGQPIALLKVDIEGADTWALMSCERLLKAGLVNEIWFEENKPRMDLLGIPRDAAQRYLESVGYKCTAHNNLDDMLVEWSAVRC